MLHDDFEFFRPCESLAPYVRYYWVFRSSRPLSELTFPIGCPQIIFHKKTPLFVPELNVAQHRFTVSGQVNFSSHLSSEGRVEMIVVVFRPHTMNLFLGVPASQFYNHEVSGYDIENKQLNELADRIFDCEDVARCISFIESWLLIQITNSFSNAANQLKRISAVVEQIIHTPQISIDELSSCACWSKKQFERQFKTFVGINPKEYARIVRFQKVLSILQKQSNKELNYAQIAYLSGYSDQSHMIREFTSYSGHTPSRLIKVADPYSDLFTEPV